MRKHVRSVIIVVAVVVTVASGPAAENPRDLQYELEDQFGSVHTDEECRGAVTILLGGGRKGVVFIEDWGPSLHRAFARQLDDGSICSIGFAHLKGAPFFVRKKIIESFPRDPEAWTLLDWKGHIARSWGAEKGVANLYLFDRDGRFVLREGLREFDRTHFDRIVGDIEKVAAGR